uniref:Uncharacterized protein n=1 Tax=Arundo donax TaxID=35708 RepID=A0A0A9B7N1_ARUDO
MSKGKKDISSRFSLLFSQILIFY